jgi:hypothetical protein
MLTELQPPKIKPLEAPAPNPRKAKAFILDERTSFTKLVHSYLDKVMPHSLQHFIERNPSMRFDYPVPHESIYLAGEIQWSRIGETTDYQRMPRSISKPLFGRRDTPDLGYADEMTVLLLQSLFIRSERPNFSCDIKSVYGLSASKSRLENFFSLSEFAQFRCKSLIADVTLEGFHKNLAHTEIRIIHSPGRDSFYRHAWDWKLYLQNQGGSHHFAAAHHIAQELNIDFTLSGTLIQDEINLIAAHELSRQFHMLVISGNSRLIMREALACGFGLNYLEVPLPLPRLEQYDPLHVDEPCAIFLPKGDRKSAPVAQLLKQRGFTDLARVFDDMVKLQTIRLEQVAIGY